MWSIDVLVFSILSAGFTSLAVTRQMASWFESLLRFPQGILVSVKMVPEIETSAYIASIVLFALGFLVVSCAAAFLKKRYSGFDQCIALINTIALTYLLITPQLSIFNIDLVHSGALVISAIIAVLLFRFVKLPADGLEILIGLVSLRWLLKPMVKFDVGAAEFPTAYEYIYYALSLVDYVIVTVCAVLLYRKSSIVQNLARRIILRELSGILFISVSISLLFLMTRARAPVDIYFTLLPAYHIVLGGTPLVNVMSQYGLLYLAPWVLWLVLLPSLPITFQMGSVITCLLLIGYFSFLFRVGRTLYSNRIVYLAVMVAAYYFTILVRYYRFPDPYSLVSAPAFTPLRFGIFILPLYFLAKWSREQGKSQYIWFLHVSAILFFYSFEAGIGVLLCAVFISFIHALESKNKRIYIVLHDWLQILIGLAGVAGLISAATLIRVGRLPDFGMYWSFAIAFGSGFLALPIAGQSGVFFVIAVTLFGGIYGLHQIFALKNRYGFVPLYLCTISLVQLPYYMGRSVYPTLYNVSLAFILLCGVLTEHYWERRNTIALLLFGFVLCIGLMRGGLLIADTIVHTPDVSVKAYLYIRAAGTWWAMKRDPRYVFVHNNLPAGCPFVSFDSDESSLLPALGVYPAFQYAFLRGFVVSKKQVDALKPQQNANNICLFVTRAFAQSGDDLMDGVMQYFWKQHGGHATLIASDRERGYYLYTIPSDSFIAK